jgi:hypothetical protein
MLFRKAISLHLWFILIVDWIGFGRSYNIFPVFHNFKPKYVTAILDVIGAVPICSISLRNAEAFDSFILLQECLKGKSHNCLVGLSTVKTLQQVLKIIVLVDVQD